ncbi:UV radiation resistance protein and autophagy-related subunit 14-domain-containing protein [Annulohypoxylon truncatum]|uniref:UV radiation resistance protein and autophagy-related subunit 14-domain-containing protein n=1 Tax=Annulohypoxylon truncatum TaxID=327061 RepID=UPI0020082598|nr:UV radiation resistance protein and autophagy-related subunit 14-domain-containing protein [Annulohypoxylon truncatum]KAI1205432.1 UV radiation resistance protein and autophagy-related subunit 14-domain-containing protein [Annulohypoxylon truncatum]
MNCDICQRAHHPNRLPFFCTVDARNKLYDGRLANAEILMKTEELESRMTKLLSDADVSSDAPARRSRTYIENCASEEYQAKERTDRIIAAADKLRDEVAAAKKEIEERKASMARKRSDLATASQGITARRTRQLEEPIKAAKMIRYTWDREYEAMTQYRAALCMEVAKLYRLQRIKRGNPVRFEYKIGGIDIVDLCNMNSAQPELISASLAHITHLLWLTSHYLSIRLPAEITLPHNDYPRPTIFSLTSSYHHGDVAFPGTSLLPPDPRDRQFAHVPHPRPLFLDKPLSTLAKEDSAAYNTFLEGVILLAYDIVWLCRTQGVPVGDNSNQLEDFSQIGRNLYNLLINSSLQRNPQQIADAPPSQTASHSNNSRSGGSGLHGSNSNGNSAGDDEGSNGSTAAELGKAGPRMGLYSHGTAHTYLGGAAGTELTRGFKMPNVMKMADRLRARLLRETTPAPEWELLEDDAWTPDDALDDGVLVGGGAAPAGSGARGGQLGVPGHRFGIESYMSVNTVKSGSSGDHVPSSRVPPHGSGAAVAGRDREKGGERERERGTSGWTKIKPR